MHVVQTHDAMAQNFRRLPRRTAAFALSVALVLCLAVGAAVNATLSQETDDRRLHNALAVTTELESLLTLHVAANTDFLKGVGTAGYSSRAWPIKRAAAVAAAYDHLEYRLAGQRAAIGELLQLRRLSARWPQELEAAARSIALADRGVPLDPALLQRANDTLGSVMSLLTTLRSEERELIAEMQFNAQAQLARQKISLAIASAAAALLLLFAFYTSHRAALSRSAAKIVSFEAERRFKEYFEQHPVAMLIYDVRSYAILTANAAAQRQYRATLEQLRATGIDQLRPQADVDAFRNDLQTYIESGRHGGSAGVRRHKCLDGTVIFVDVAYHLLEYAGRDACFVTAHDVTEHEQAKEQLRVRSSALEASRNAVIISRKLEDQSIITYVNAAFEQITGHSTSDATGADHWEMLGCDVAKAEVQTIRQAMQIVGEGSALLKCYRRDGSPYWNELHVSPVLDHNNRPTHCVTVFYDVSDRISYQEQLRTQAYEDSLTHLPNRLGLNARLNEMFASATENGHKLALVFFDLDNFKEVNDSLGHTAGDLVLCEVARRLSAIVSHQEVVVRYAGDEFVAVLYGRKNVEDFVAAATAMRESLRQGFLVENKVVIPQASVGLAVFPDHSDDPDSLLKHADSAMYRAKSIGPNSIQVFNKAIAAQESERLHLAHDLRRAVHSDAFSIVYQPRLDLGTDKANGFEALLRWNHPERGEVSPSLFIPLAEENGLIVQIGNWVFEQACRQTKTWAHTHPNIVVSVNVSPVQFIHSDLPALIAASLARTGVSPHNIELEITEGTLMAPRSLSTVCALRDMGLSIAIDDFGSGYSSLGYVRSFMPDRLKLDMSFVKGIGHSRVDEVIVKTVLAMGHTLGIRIVAEGVETHEQLDFLRTHGCDEVQGYLVARPIDVSTAASHLG
ncbi:phosphodiesterase [Paraburkholderia terrae]|uniref:Phosphodiesterase n=2 Tax=Paraburkholderia terrae TaxID=311230 RepID=A0A2I8F249_9BURK|nr:phosphodiesterase [Paraburkholderia terrae]